jgi:hypothetical protein
MIPSERMEILMLRKEDLGIEFRIEISGSNS